MDILYIRGQYQMGLDEKTFKLKVLNLAKNVAKHLGLWKTESECYGKECSSEFVLKVKSKNNYYEFTFDFDNYSACGNEVRLCYYILDDMKDTFLSCDCNNVDDKKYFEVVAKCLQIECNKLEKALDISDFYNEF